MSIMSRVHRAGYVHTNGMSIMSRVDRGYVHLMGVFFVIIFIPLKIMSGTETFRKKS